MQRAGLAVIDLIGFKQINDALGQSVGDQVLISVGERLADLAGPSELVARVSGDEFAVLLTSIDSTADALARTRELLAAIAQPLTVDDVRLDIAATAGVAVISSMAISASCCGAPTSPCSRPNSTASR